MGEETGAVLGERLLKGCWKVAEKVAEKVFLFHLFISSDDDTILSSDTQTAPPVADSIQGVLYLQELAGAAEGC